jgi:hypothetical protein
MAWAYPQFTREEVDAAGDSLINPDADSATIDKALIVLNNWRSAHAFPLNTFQNGLRNRVMTVDHTAVVAQRIKRLSSIEKKLRRPMRLRLSEIQDIGGCRAIVNSVQQVSRVVELCKESRHRHVQDDEDDYISGPKTSGYRSHHLIYQYHSDRNSTYNELKIEVQIRTQLQHAWATAVETVSTFTRQNLKSGSGKKDWRRFFLLMSSSIAMREGTSLAPGTPVDPGKLKDELRDHIESHGMLRKLDAFNRATGTEFDPALAHVKHVLIVLDFPNRRTWYRYYESSRSQEAFKEYSRLEQESPYDVVLVSMDSLRDLRRAYPNYFLDMDEFLRAVRHAIS